MDNPNLKAELAYYAAPGPFTHPGLYSSMLAGLPTDLPGLVKVVQNTLLHVFWAERYGVSLREEQKVTLQMRSVQSKLAALQAAGAASLLEPRSVEQRQVGNCRDFSLLLCALLRCQGVPARARCGFGTYFWPGRFEDHWVCEYWNASSQRWVMVDSQLDELQQEVLKLDFDPLDMPEGKFLTGGQAWQMARRGEADPELFGIFDMHGLWFISGNLVRDMLALNKVEILPWDHGWGIMSEDETQAGPESERPAFIETLAELTIPGQENFSALRALFESDRRLHAPESYFAQPEVG
jgi:hypothetical protein